MHKLNALIAGKKINIKYLCGNSSVGKSISFFDKSLVRFKLPKIKKFKKEYLENVDVVFTALPNGESQEISNYLSKNNTLIDLAADFRLEKSSDYLKWYKQKHKAKDNIKNSIYALPEISNLKVKRFKIIACPGCYPTSILLPLIPLVQKKLISSKNIIVDSKSGFSGGGRTIHKKYKNKNLYESLSAYGISFHRHNSEIEQELKKFTKSKISLTFTPHLSPMFRGILSTIYVDLKPGYSINKIYSVLKKFHKKNQFVKILRINSLLSTNDVINTNNCYISVCKTRYKNKVLILSVIDNLIKGGAGQAVQNMNLKFDFRKNEGLQ